MAGATIGQAGLDAVARAVAVGVFVVIGSATVLGPVLMQLLAPRRAADTLEPIRRFMTQHNDGMMGSILLVLGAKLLGNGIGGSERNTEAGVGRPSPGDDLTRHG